MVTRYTSPGEAAAAPAHGAPAMPTQTVVLGKRVTAEWWTLFRSPNLDTLVSRQSLAAARWKVQKPGWLRRARRSQRRQARFIRKWASTPASLERSKPPPASD